MLGDVCPPLLDLEIGFSTYISASVLANHATKMNARNGFEVRANSSHWVRLAERCRVPKFIYVPFEISLKYLTPQIGLITCELVDCLEVCLTVYIDSTAVRLFFMAVVEFPEHMSHGRSFFELEDWAYEAREVCRMFMNGWVQCEVLRFAGGFQELASFVREGSDMEINLFKLVQSGL